MRFSKRNSTPWNGRDKVIEAGEHGKGGVAKNYEHLFKAYEKLFKTTRKLVRLSDRSEAELNKVSKDLDGKNMMLEGLSAKLSKYLSPQIYEAIFSGVADADVRTARKKLTVFFSDIKDFTATTEEMEPEDMTFLLNDYLTKMTEIALEHGGTIDKYIGDAIMVFFGDPESRGIKKDAQAAVSMAMAMQRRMVDLRAKWADMGFRLPFHIRCGVNTGYCNVGNFGSDQRIDYTIIGGQVNLARAVGIDLRTRRRRDVARDVRPGTR